MATTYSSSHTGAQIDSVVNQLVTTPILKFSDITVSTWESNPDTELANAGYQYRGTIPCSGVTSEHIPTVIFNYAQLSSGNYSPYADTGAGIVYIYSKVSTTISVPTILCV